MYFTCPKLSATLAVESCEANKTPVAVARKNTTCRNCTVQEREKFISESGITKKEYLESLDLDTTVTTPRSADLIKQERILHAERTARWKRAQYTTRR